MAGLTAAEGRGARLRRFAVDAPRLLMSWEDWFTLVPALVTYAALAVAVQQASWVRDFPTIAPTVIGAMVVGLAAARTRASQWLVQPAALLLGLALVMTTAQPYGVGDAFTDRVADLVARMREWVAVVRAGDVSTDNMPFVLMVHGLGAIGAYTAAWAIFRWRNAWLAVIPAGAGLLAIIATTKGQPPNAFLMFSIGALLLVARLHLQRSLAGWDRERVDRPEWLSAQAAQLAVALTVVMVVFAWLLPIGRQAAATERALSAIASPFERIADPVERLFTNLGGGGGNFHKFGTTLAIRGDVELGKRVLFEVRGDFTGLVRGTSYDRYTGAGWKATERAETETTAGEAITAGVEGRAYRDRAVTELDVTVFDDEEALFSTGTPLGANIDARASLPRAFAGDIERLRARGDFSNGDSYRVLGSVSRASPDQLRADSTAYPAWVRERYLQLPDDLPERVAEEAATAVEEAGAANPYDLALAIQTRLRDLETDFGVHSAPSRQDAVDYLLFDLGRGYFDYFATAMTVMLRTQGVPARIAVGYLLDPEDFEPSDDSFSVRKNDAYSWVEAFFPTYGWVEFLAGEELVVLGEGGGLLTGGADGGFVELPLDTLPLDVLGGEAAELTLDELLTPFPDTGGGPPRELFWGIGGALAALAAALLGGRLVWMWGLRGLRGMPRQWGGVERLAGWAGLRAADSESARRWGERLGEALGRPDEATALSAAFEEARYGPPDLERSSADETADAYRALRNALAARLIGRGRRPHADKDAEGEGADEADEAAP